MPTLLCIEQRKQRIFYLLYLNWRASLPDFSSFSWGHVTHWSHKGDQHIPTHLHQHSVDISVHNPGARKLHSCCCLSVSFICPASLPMGAISLYIWTVFHRKAYSFVLPPTLPPSNLKASRTKHPPLLMTSLPPSQWCWASSSAWSSLSHRSIEGYLAPPSAADTLITLINQISNLDSYTSCFQFYVPFSFSLCPFLSSGELGRFSWPNDSSQEIDRVFWNYSGV
jgi:hypothetical protein